MKKLVVFGGLFFLQFGCICANLELSVIPHKYTISLEEFATLKELFSPDVFVETGTYRGYTTAVAASLFNEVKTIELCSEIYRDTKARLEKDYTNIEFFEGNSAFVLPAIARKLDQKALFYLDAHFCFDGTAKDFNDPPVLGELEAVLVNAPKDAITVIDDLRVFANNQRLAFDAYNYYPSILDIHRFVKEKSPESSLFILGDEAIIFNQNYHPIEISKLVQSITKSLVSDDIEGMFEGDLGLIYDLDSKDRASLENLYALYEDMDLSLISFWLGLSYFSIDAEKALSFLVKATKCGFYHPRIYAYIGKLKGKIGGYKSEEIQADFQRFLKAYPEQQNLVEIL